VPFYRPSTDSIMLPLFETCRGADSYYATIAHETTHWTAHESRMVRDFGTTRFGSEGYAIDELVAELGAAFLCADLIRRLSRVRTTPPTSPTGCRCSRQTTRAIFTAASHAQRAADFIVGLQPAACAGSLPTVASGAHRIRPIDILYVVAYVHAEYL
jgi:antirestriction protein ArdC